MTDTAVFNQDWADLCDRILLAWPEPELRQVRRLEDLLVVVRRDPDAVLAALLRRAQAGDTLAGRAVIQAMLPKLALMAARDRTAGVAEYCAQLWCVLMRYPVDRRRGSVAGGLALDTLKAVVRERPASQGHVECELMHNQNPAGAEDDAEVVIRRAAALGLLDEVTERILIHRYVDGLTSAATGAQVGLSAAAVRQRCCTAIRCLAKHSKRLAA